MNPSNPRGRLCIVPEYPPRHHFDIAPPPEEEEASEPIPTIRRRSEPGDSIVQVFLECTPRQRLQLLAFLLIVAGAPCLPYPSSKLGGILLASWACARMILRRPSEPSIVLIFAAVLLFLL